MAINLSRNTRVWFTTNVNSTTGKLTDANSGFTSTNTYEIQVLDGYSFTQATSTTMIEVNEAGNTPVRGGRNFNTALNPVDFSFSTYIRPRLAAANNVTAIEGVLWNALTSADSVDYPATSSLTANGASATAITRVGTASVSGSTANTTIAGVVLTGTATGLKVGDSINISGVTSHQDWNGPGTIKSVLEATNTTISVEYANAPSTAAGLTGSGTAIKFTKGSWTESITNTTATPPIAYASFVGSNKNQLQKFAMIFMVDNVAYAVDNCVLDQASIDFGLDAISTIAWTGKGTVLKQLATLTPTLLVNTWTNGTNYTKYNTAAQYITNKLSTATLTQYITGTTTGNTAGQAYSIPLTGGNITFANNTNYLTPTNLGVVNEPCTYYTGTRGISGSLNAYLKTGTTGDAGSLLNTILTNINTSDELEYKLQIEIGGLSNPVRVEIDMDGASLQVPTVNVEDVVSTTINFMAQGHNPNSSAQQFDLERTNDATIRYLSA
jgi:hypothetical protein